MIRAWYTLHSWCGALVALLLFLVFASGCVALFFNALQPWQHPELRHIKPAEDGIRFDRMLQIAREQGWADDGVTFGLPAHSHAVLLTLPDESYRIAIFDPGSGELIAVKPEGFTRFLRRLHTDLLLPFPLGAYLVGSLGAVLLLMVVTGIVLHRRMLRQLFTFRRGQGRRLAWSDAHKLLGAWGLLFQALMGFTGAALGLAGLLFVLTAAVAYRGDMPQAYREVLGSYPEPSGTAAALGDINPMLTHEFQGERFIPRYVTIRNPGDAQATITVEGERPDRLSDASRKTFDREGQLVGIRDGVRSGIGWRAYSALVPLHLGNFGGPWLKLVYWLLGLAAVGLPVSGAFLWLDRQRRQPLLRDRYDLLLRLGVGFVAGFPVMLATLFLLDKLAPAAWLQQSVLAWMFFGGWGMLLAWAARRHSARQVLSELLHLGGVLCLLVAPVNGLVTGDHLLVQLVFGQVTTVQLTDAALVLLGAYLLWAGLTLRKQPA